MNPCPRVYGRLFGVTFRGTNTRRAVVGLGAIRSKSWSWAEAGALARAHSREIPTHSVTKAWATVRACGAADHFGSKLYGAKFKVNYSSPMIGLFPAC